MKKNIPIIAALTLSSSVLAAQGGKAIDAAAAFGARPSIEQMSLSPDGMSVVYIAPSAGQGATAYTLSLAKGSVPKPALAANGNPDRVNRCDWVSNQRLVCMIYGVIKGVEAFEPVAFSRAVAINADGSNLKMLSSTGNNHSRGLQLDGGDIVDWLPEEDSAVLIERTHLADDRIESRLGSARSGLALDRLDTRNLSVKTVLPPSEAAVEYITDGRGNARIMGSRSTHGGGQESPAINYSYRVSGSTEWSALSRYDVQDGSGFEPLAVDPDLNVVYGFKKRDGRIAVYSIALDGSLNQKLVYADPNVDVAHLVHLGRRHRVVGVSYVTDRRQVRYFDPELDRLVRSLTQALPGHPAVGIVDSSVDESKLLVFASRDDDPGVYYLFDRKTKRLDTFLVVRNELEGVKLASVKPVTYPAADGTLIPGYLTLPPGVENAQHIRAIVLPHGGPSARDEGGFDWLAQFYAARGYAVLQPNFRGSAGYGDSWFQQNGFKSWKIAINDVLDAGRWLVSQGIADPAKLGIVGWSYGGYAALQSAATDPSLFKAVVAIAPVTDLNALKEEHRDWADFYIVSNFVGDGPHVREGSPTENAAKIKAPVILFHGALDRNVTIEQSKNMDARLEKAGVRHELVTWPNLDHQLEDSSARKELLSKSDAFLRQAMGITD